MNIFGYPDGTFSEMGGGTSGGGDQSAATYTATDQFLGRDGTDAKPAYSFTSEHSSGIQKSAIGELSLTSLGVKRLRCDSSNTDSYNTLRIQDGSDSVPSLSFILEPSSGLERSLAGEISTTTLGSKRLAVGSTRVRSYVPIQVPDGTMTSPSLTSSTTQAGVYFKQNSSSLPSVAISAGGVDRLVMSSDYTELYGYIFAPDGTAHFPTYGFSQGGAGMYYDSATSEVHFSTFSTPKFTIADTFVESLQPYYAQLGSATKPQYSFTSATSSGFYSDTKGSVSTSIAGTLALSVSSTATESKNPYLAQLSTTPTYSFVGQTGSGMFWDSGAVKITGPGTTSIIGLSASVAAITVGTASTLTLSTGSLTSSVPIQQPALTYTPTYSFVGSNGSQAGMSFDEPSGTVFMVVGDGTAVTALSTDGLDLSVNSLTAESATAGDDFDSLCSFPRRLALPTSTFYAHIGATSFARFRRDTSFATTVGWASSPAFELNMGTLSTLITDPCSNIVPHTLSGTYDISLDNTNTYGVTQGPCYRITGKINWQAGNTTIGVYELWIATNPTAIPTNADDPGNYRIGSQSSTGSQEVSFSTIVQAVTNLLSYNVVATTGPGLNTLTILSQDLSIERLYW